MTFAYDTDVVMDDGTIIKTTVTNSGDATKLFLREVRQTRKPLIVGLDTEWRVIRRQGRRPRNRMAVLQLCVGHRCLVFQIVAADYVPAALKAFLASPQHRFVGVVVDVDVERLRCDCNIVVNNTVDLRYAAADVLGRPHLRTAGLKILAREVMGVEIEKPKHLTCSEWDRPLSQAQVRYAAIDAFVSYEVGRLVLTREHAQDAAFTGAMTILPSQLP
ncbi:Werner syndrome ATP-dependent helicase [Zea mays]|jgi:ribonuclease D|nr:uncharacterized protein LOC100280337 [Zea mays]ACG34724.1 3-5 exonuclease family protein [Zea mays]ACL54642.1 unknown [Zea mays]PWZ09272.1 Werner syndrome ATP-dependent helicase [Zea mays]|eukprot:NP_001307478.1 uncharacterized protein LOC100280337 [Zea mays]